MACLSVCSSFLQTRLPNNLKTATHLNYTSFCLLQNNLIKTQSLSSNSLKKTHSFLTKVSQLQDLVVQNEEDIQVFQQTNIEEAKREEIFAVVMVLERSEETNIEEAKIEEIFAVVLIGGRQYIVFPGRFITTQRFKGANVNDKVILNKVLLVGTKNSTYVGKPLVPNATVHAVVEEQGLNKKVVVFKYKKKKNYRRNIGHRQPNTRIKILGITGYEDSTATTL